MNENSTFSTNTFPNDGTDAQAFIWNPRSNKLICLLNRNEDENNVVYSRFGGTYELRVKKNNPDAQDPIGILFLWNEIDIWNKPDLIKDYKHEHSVPAIVFLEIAIDITKTYNENIYYEEQELHSYTRNFVIRENIMIPWSTLLVTIPEKISQ